MSKTHRGSGVLGLRKTISRSPSESSEYADTHPRLRHKPCLASSRETLADGTALPRGLVSRLSMLELSRLTAPTGPQFGPTASSLHCGALSDSKLRRSRSATSLGSVGSVPTTEQAMIDGSGSRLAVLADRPGGSRNPSPAPGKAPTTGCDKSRRACLRRGTLSASTSASTDCGRTSDGGDAGQTSSLFETGGGTGGGPPAAGEAALEGSADGAAGPSGSVGGRPLDALLQPLLQPLVERVVPEAWRGTVEGVSASAWAAASQPLSTGAGVSAWAAARAYGLAPVGWRAWPAGSTAREVVGWLQERPGPLAGLGSALGEWQALVEEQIAQQQEELDEQRRAAVALREG